MSFCKRGRTPPYTAVRRRIRNLPRQRENRRIYDEMKLISECHSKSFRYPVIKRWFLERLPERKTFGVPAEEEAESEAPVEETAEARKLAWSLEWGSRRKITT